MSPAPGERITPSAWGLLAFLTFLNVLNFVDRTLIASLAPLLIRDLGISRAQIGLLVGFGFVLFYSAAGLLLGLVADRWRRLPLIAAGLALWSAMTALSGAARGFLHLALPRLFVGIGEATLTPASLSMLADRFPRSRLATASGIYYAGVPLGTAVSLLASSWIAPRWGWRACFVVLGAVGLAAVPLLFAFREPARTGDVGPRPTLAALVSELVGALRARREIALVLLGGSLVCFGSAAATLNVTWLVEERGFPFADAAFTAGLIAIGSGLAGNVLGGLFADRCARRGPAGRITALAWMALAFALATAPFLLLPARTPAFYLAWFLSAAAAGAWFGPFFTALQELSPAATRASSVGLGLVAISLLGVGPGPLVAGAIGDARSLGAGLLTSTVVVVTAVVPFALAARRVRLAG